MRTNRPIDQPTNQPIDGHEGSLESSTFTAVCLNSCVYETTPVLMRRLNRNPKTIRLQYHLSLCIEWPLASMVKSMKNEANLVDSDIIILCKNKMQNDKQKNSTLCFKKGCILLGSSLNASESRLTFCYCTYIHTFCIYSLTIYV